MTKHVVHKNMVVGSSMIGFPLEIAISEQDMPGIERGPLGWHTSALTNELQEIHNKLARKFQGASNYCPSVASDQNTDPKVAGSAI